MEEKIIRHLNWMYYGVMALTLIALTGMYYLTSKGLIEPIDPLSQQGTILQYLMIFTALGAIPFGLYLVKWKKPDTLDKYEQLAGTRICMIGGLMPPAIILYYLLGCHRPMLWITAIAAVAWYFTKPTLGKMEQEMKPKDPNAEDY
ncbi:MAG: hypothetical protein IJ814_01750 [Paludibacteraceae bacterium]|nr:hypothetical protein [Paludibacteraceae bacterium]